MNLNQHLSQVEILDTYIGTTLASSIKTVTVKRSCSYAQKARASVEAAQRQLHQVNHHWILIAELYNVTGTFARQLSTEIEADLRRIERETPYTTYNAAIAAFMEGRWLSDDKGNGIIKRYGELKQSQSVCSAMETGIAAEANGLETDSHRIEHCNSVFGQVEVKLTEYCPSDQTHEKMQDSKALGNIEPLSISAHVDRLPHTQREEPYGADVRTIMWWPLRIIPFALWSPWALALVCLSILAFSPIGGAQLIGNMLIGLGLLVWKLVVRIILPSSLKGIWMAIATICETVSTVAWDIVNTVSVPFRKIIWLLYRPLARHNEPPYAMTLGLSPSAQHSESTQAMTLGLSPSAQHSESTHVMTPGDIITCAAFTDSGRCKRKKKVEESGMRAWYCNAGKFRSHRLQALVPLNKGKQISMK
ncbi:MAG: hypothetical protein Q9202_000237 [Teloschistes flavicans]